MTQRRKLSNTTWTLGDKPCKTLKMTTGCWTDVARARKTGKVGKQHSSLVKFKQTDASRK